ncbi:maleylpyruvate isomerase N-terminal domain-containing protein [Nocardiopsis chromatogenes]|uniref:maleylpyruvate isomerase N-terminal domain-containing protein n=1 Tax=Nocardiopsis chromatogenes TaxID=280239 RepID=UPI00373AF04B
MIDPRLLFPGERALLLDLMADLDREEWSAPAVCPGWDVHDVAAHVLHDYTRRLSGGRDGHHGPPFAGRVTGGLHPPHERGVRGGGAPLQPRGHRGPAHPPRAAARGVVRGSRPTARRPGMPLAAFSPADSAPRLTPPAFREHSGPAMDMTPPVPSTAVIHAPPPGRPVGGQGPRRPRRPGRPVGL